MDFAKSLARQKPHLVPALAPVTDQIIRGEVRVGITYIKYVKQYKGPIDYVLMDQYLSEGEFVLYPGVTPAIKNADKVAQSMVLMEVPTGEELKKLMDDFHRIFFGT